MVPFDRFTVVLDACTILQNERGLVLAKNAVAVAVGVITCTLSLTPLFLHSYGCDPYDEYLPRPRPDPSSGLDNPYGFHDCFGPPLLPLGGPAPVLCWVIALLGLFLTARISDQSHERIAVGVGMASTLLAALTGFAISGLDPTLVLTDLDFYSCFPLTVAFGVIFGKLELRRRSS
jgi:hypothetical protein